MNEEKKKKSQVWWASLSINEMKQLSVKYFPSCSWTMVNVTPSFVLKIYEKENP
jgi:hypothetical protein